jgi:hypothetical protein
LITTQAAFVAAVNDALANCYVAVFDGKSKFQIASTVTFNVKDCGQGPTGFNGNGMQISSTVNTGGGVLKFVTTSANRSLVLQGFAIFGDSYSGKNAGTCVTLQAEKNKAFYKFTIRDVWLDYCSGNGLDLIGDIFEGGVWNLQAENSNGSGLFMNHGTDCGIISNVFVWGLNASRNHRYGMELGTRAGCGGASSVHAFALDGQQRSRRHPGDRRHQEHRWRQLREQRTGLCGHSRQRLPVAHRRHGDEHRQQHSSDPQAAGGGSRSEISAALPIQHRGQGQAERQLRRVLRLGARRDLCAGVQLLSP